jgi:hypothetical protein
MLTAELNQMKDLNRLFDNRLMELEKFLRVIREDDLIPWTVKQVKMLSGQSIEMITRVARLESEFNSHRDAVGIGQARQEDRMHGIEGRLNALVRAVEGFAQDGVDRSARIDELSIDINAMAGYTGYDTFRADVDPSDWPQGDSRKSEEERQKSARLRQKVDNLGLGLQTVKANPEFGKASIIECVEDSQPQRMVDKKTEELFKGKPFSNLRDKMSPERQERATQEADRMIDEIEGRVFTDAEVLSLRRFEIHIYEDNGDMDRRNRIIAGGREYPDGHLVITWFDNLYTETYTNMEELQQAHGQRDNVTIEYLD